MEKPTVAVVLSNMLVAPPRYGARSNVRVSNLCETRKTEVDAISVPKVTANPKRTHGQILRFRFLVFSSISYLSPAVYWSSVTRRISFTDVTPLNTFAQPSSRRVFMPFERESVCI